MMQLQNYDLPAIMETRWGESHNWNRMIKAYQLFGRDRKGRRGKGVALYVKKWIDHEELSLRNSHIQLEST